MPCHAWAFISLMESIEPKRLVEICQMAFLKKTQSPEILPGSAYYVIIRCYFNKTMRLLWLCLPSLRRYW